MRLVHTADLHLGRPVRFGHSDSAIVLDRLVATVAGHRPSLVILAGDTFDNRHPSAEAIDLFAQAAYRLTRHAQVLVVPGNHDGMATVADAGTHTLAWARSIQMEGLHVSLGPEVVEYPDCMVFAMPYPHKRAYDAVMPGADALTRMQAIAADVDALIASRRAEIAASPHPMIFAGHLSVSGAILGSERAMRLEDDVTISADVLEGFNYAALGHIHRQQAITPSIWYAGSPEYLDFGDVGHPKGFLVAEIVIGAEPTMTFVQSAPRPMVTVDLESIEAEMPAVPKDAIVRVRVTLDSGSTEGLRRVIRDTYMDAGASHVQVEFILPERTVTSTRAITQPMTDQEALAAYLRSRDLPDEPYVGAAAALEES